MRCYWTEGSQSGVDREVYIYIWKGDVSSRAVIRSSALVRSSSHHNIDRL